MDLPAHSRPGRRPLVGGRLALVGLALGALLRIAQQVTLATDPTFAVLHGNAAGFMELARRIFGGDLLGGEEVFFYGPLYPYFLAACFGGVGFETVWIPRAVQALVGLILGVLVYRVTRDAIGDERAALWSGGLMLVYGPALFFEGLLVAATTSTFLLVLAVALLVRPAPGSGTGSWWSLLAAGAALGLCCWGRGNVLALVPVAAAWLAWQHTAWTPRLRAVGLFAAGVALTILPVTVRNRVVGGDWVLLVSQAGINFYIGNNPEGHGTFELPERAGITTDVAGRYERQTREVAERELGRSLRPSEVSRYWTRRAVRWITSDPAAAAALGWRKVRLLVDPYEVPIHRNAQLHLDRSVVTRFLPRWGIVLPLALAGLVLCWPLRGGTLLLVALAGTYAGTVVGFFVSDRYRFLLVPLVLPFAGLAAERLGSAVLAWIRRRRVEGGRRLALAAGIVVLGVAVVHGWVPGLDPTVLTPEMRGRYLALELHRYGRAEENRGDPAAALEWYERAVEHAPGHVNSRLGQVRTLLATGRTGEAREILSVLAKVAPESVEVRRLLDEVAR